MICQCSLYLQPLPFQFTQLFFLRGYFLLKTDCAVCEEGYASGVTYSCHACFDWRSLSAGIAVAGTVIILLIVFFIVSDLMQAVGGEGADALSSGGAGRFDTPWKGVLFSCRNYIVNAVPLTAVKIVVVVWQIVTQVTNPPILSKILQICNGEVVSGTSLNAECIKYLHKKGRTTHVFIVAE